MKPEELKKCMEEVLRSEADAILSVRVTDAFIAALRTMKKCHGKVLTCGMGKAGLVARKFASTLCSTATPAAFIHPGEAAHGDLGLAGPDDCIVAFSTSGKTREVIEMLQLSRHLGIKTIIGVTSHPDSELHRLCDIVIDMGIIEEPCPLGLTPTASIAVMLAISDALAIALMKWKNVTREDFGLRHHGGYLGKKARE